MQRSAEKAGQTLAVSSLSFAVHTAFCLALAAFVLQDQRLAERFGQVTAAPEMSMLMPPREVDYVTRAPLATQAAEVSSAAQQDRERGAGGPAGSEASRSTVAPGADAD